MQTSIPLLALGLMLFAGAGSANSLVGQVIPPYVDGWVEEGGSCLANCDYSIGVLKKSRERQLYFGKAAANSTPNKPHWEILDHMSYPSTPKGFELVYGICQNNGKADDSIIAVVKNADTEWLDKVRFAYKANISTGQFETIATKGVRCENVAAGL